MCDRVEHEHQLPQTWTGHVLHVRDTEVGSGLYEPQKPSLNVTGRWPVARAVNQRQS